MKRSDIAFSVVIILVSAVGLVAQSRLLTDQRYLSEFPTVDRIKAEVKGTDDIDSFGRFLAALTVIDRFVMNDLANSPNGGASAFPVAAVRVHDRYKGALDSYTPPNYGTSARLPKYIQLRDRYAADPAFADYLLQKFFSAEFRTGYYAWTRKPMPSSTASSYGTPPAGTSSTTTSSAARPVRGRPTCPRVAVSGPTEVDADQPVTFTASVTGMDPNDDPPTYNWTVSAGTISSGQGTSTITVDTTDAQAGSTTATVTIGGLDAACRNNSASETTGIKPKPLPALKFDEFGSLRIADRNARLDNFAIQLQNDPMARGYVITYGGRTSLATAAKISGEKMKDYLVNTRGIEADRIVLIDGGRREKPFSELWYVQRGSTPPKPSPTIAPSTTKPPAGTKPPVKKRT